MAKQQPDQKAEERRRLKDVAFSNGLLSRVPSRQPPAAPLVPSKTVVKHQGRDIVKKGQRKNRFLFSFPGFLAPVSGGGKIGELSNLATGNPILYLDFPQGRIKLFGTIVYPKNRYLTLQFARKNVLCDDSFDSMVVFTDAWWIGRKEDNPEENQLKFPNELNEKQEDYDFKGGAGDIYVGSSACGKPPVKQTHLVVPDVSLTDDMSEDSEDATKDAMQLTPVRHSTRTAGKSLNYAEYSSEEVSLSGETNKLDAIDDHCATEAQSSNPYSEMPNTWSPDVTLGNIKNQETEVKKTSTSKKSKGKSSSKRGPLVQATLSTLFEKSTSKVTMFPSCH